MAGLMLAGESIYMLPYMRRTFQTSMEEVFALSGTEVGLLNGMFGILAVLCYFPGGWLADRFSARKLLTFSLIATSIGGLAMLSIPSYSGLFLIHAWWGVTSILTFWGALIKATRGWGSSDNQGTTFGLLDAGRGAAAAVLASLATAVFAMGASTKASLQGVILVYSLAPLLTSIIICFTVPDTFHKENPRNKQPSEEKGSLGKLKQVILKPTVWLLAVIIFCSYMLFLLPPSEVGMWGLWTNVIIAALAVFALRGIYFALLKEIGIPITFTGTVVGFVSFIGFMPDVFAHLLSGWFVDTFEGVMGYQYYFGGLAGLACVGFISTELLRRFAQKGY